MQIKIIKLRQEKHKTSKVKFVKKMKKNRKKFGQQRVNINFVKKICNVLAIPICNRKTRNKHLDVVALNTHLTFPNTRQHVRRIIL